MRRSHIPLQFVLAEIGSSPPDKTVATSIWRIAKCRGCWGPASEKGWGDLQTCSKRAADLAHVTRVCLSFWKKALKIPLSPPLSTLCIHEFLVLLILLVVPAQHLLILLLLESEGQAFLHQLLVLLHQVRHLLRKVEPRLLPALVGRGRRRQQHVLGCEICSPAKSLKLSGLTENPLVGKKLKSQHPSKMHQSVHGQPLPAPGIRAIGAAGALWAAGGAALASDAQGISMGEKGTLFSSIRLRPQEKNKQFSVVMTSF